MITFTGTSGSDLFARTAAADSFDPGPGGTDLFNMGATVATDTMFTADNSALGAGYNPNAGRGNNANH